MRILEIIFVSMLSIQLAILILNLFKQYPRRLILIGAPILFGLLHLIIEGYRWQMIPAYLLLLFLILHPLLKFKSGKALLIIRNIGLILLFVLSVLLPTLLPVLHFSNTNGTFKVGVKNIQIIDKERGEILTEDPADPREISVRLFYPSTDTGKAPYIPNFKDVKEEYAKKIKAPVFLFDYLKYYSIEAAENGALLTSGNFPLIIYSHGLTNNYTEATGRLMKLASRGYIVAAINHTYASNYAILSNGKKVSFKPLSKPDDSLEEVDSVRTMLANQWVEDAKSVIKNLRSSEFAQVVDFDNIGLLGFSAGGTMATLGSYKIENVKAAVNFDGTPRGIDESTSPGCAQLFMYRVPTYYSDAQLESWGVTREWIDAPMKLIDNRSEKVLFQAPGNSYKIKIPNTKHSNFTEYPLISPFSELLGVGGEIDSWKCYDMINEMLFSFLDANLKSVKNQFPVYPDISIKRNDK